MMGRWRWLIEVIAVGVFFTVLTVPMFYPISTQPGSMLFDRWDGCLHTWILCWDIHKFTTGLKGFFDANIFWPHRDALAYSDHLIGSALLVAPVFWITKNPLITENAVGVLSFILSGLGMYLLARRFVPGRGAAIIAGIIYAYCPWRYGQLGHQAQLLAGQWMPFALLFLHKTIDNPRWRDALLFGLFFTLQALCSFYLAALMGTAAVTIFVAEMTSRKWRASKGMWVKLIAVGVISVAIIVPTMIPYYRVQKQQGLERTEWESIQLSADPMDYFAAPPWNRIWGKTSVIFKSRLSQFPNENWLFPGFLATLLALAGLLRLSAGKRQASSLRKGAEVRLGLEWEHAQGVYLVLALTALILSFGPKFHIFWKLTPIPLPYKLLYYIVPGFKALRVPSRFAYLLMLALAILAAYGFRELERRIRGPVARYALAALVALVILAEYFSSPLPYHRLPTGDAVPGVYKWLAKQPADAVVAEVPQYLDFPLSPKGSYDPLGFTYMYYTIYHNFQPITNGRSGFLPLPQHFIWSIMLNFPSKESVNLLRYLGVQFVVLHKAAYPPGEGVRVAQRAEAFGSALKLEGEFGGDLVYRLLDPAPASVRGTLDGLQVVEADMPRRIMPNVDVDLNIKLMDTGQWPAMTFKLTDVKMIVTEKSARGTNSYERRTKVNVYLVPGQSQWLTIPIISPIWDGKYHLDVEVRFPEYPKVGNTFSFDVEAGNYPDSLNPATLRSEFLSVSVPSVVSPGQEFDIEVRVKNTGDTLWRPRPRSGSFKGVVLLGLRDWYTPDKKRLDPQPRIERGFLEKAISPDEETVIKMKAWAPETPGNYLIRLDMVDELITWFEDRGSSPVWVRVEVKAP